jgi:hypothetical protein
MGASGAMSLNETLRPRHDPLRRAGADRRKRKNPENSLAVALSLRHRAMVARRSSTAAAALPLFDRREND